MEAYKIVEWLERYEVTEKGKPANTDTPLDKLRKSPLPYVRFKVHGHAHGPAYRKMLARTWGPGEEMGVFGFFAKLLELAANQTRDYRGWILNEKQQPMTPAQIAETLGIQDKNWTRRALEILTDPTIGWVGILEFPNSPPPVEERGGALWGKKGGAYGGTLLNETETKVRENKDEGKKSTASGGKDSASDLTQKETASVSYPWGTEERKKKVFAYETVCQMVKPRCESDRTTLHHIFEQLENHIKANYSDIEIFQRVENAAKECIGARNPMAMFVSVAKERFGYQPKRDKVLKNAYR